MGGAGEGREAPVARQAPGPRADRRAARSRARSTRSAGSPAAAPTTTTARSSTVTPANFVMGRGRIDGRPVVVGGDDFTVRGGAADASIFQKQVHAERMAHDLGLPIVRLVDGSGGGGSVKTLETERRSFVPFNPGWEWVVANLGRVPVVSLCLGSVAGLGAARVVTSHYSMMVQGHEPPVRRRPRRREPARHRDGRQGDARRQQHPHPQRRGRRRGRHRGRGVRARPPVPLATCRARCDELPPRALEPTTIRSGATTGSARRDPA